MDQPTNGITAEQGLSVREFLTALAAEVDQQIVHALGGEALHGSGFECEFPEANFGREGDSND
jgi:hypothetical protein